MTKLLDSVSLLVLRIPLGIIFVAHGSQKLLGLFGGPGLSGAVSSFQQMGIPPILTILAIIAEFGGGIGLLLGFLTRFSAGALAVVMIVAAYEVHLANGFFLNASCTPGRGHGIEYNLALFALALFLALRGGGQFGLDRFFWEKK